ncbi:MAG: ArsR/SmtB family transcription factor [Halanaerobium sp.]
MDLIYIIKALAHENRLRILNLLKEKTLCVCELRNIMEINQSNASRHLRKLKNAGLIKNSKDAQWVYYQLNHKQLKKHPFIELMIKEEFENNDLFAEDNRKLKLYNQSQVSCENLDDSDIFNQVNVSLKE